MATYLIINIIFIACMVLLLRIPLRRPSRRSLVLLAILLVMTVVFDSLIVHFGIVDYDPAKILGVYVGWAPIEDLFYAVFAVILIPFLWKRFGGKDD